MADGFHIKIEGDIELKKLFARLPKKFEDRAIRSMARAAAVPIVKEARRRVPKKSGALKRAIGTQTVKRKPAVAVKVRRKVINTGEGPKIPVQYAKALAKGNKVRKGRGRVKNPIGDFIQDAGRVAGGAARRNLIAKSKKIINTQIAKYKASARR